ncbi:glycosyltransferase [Caloramator sp. Dgby_cultured_2]|uniref:glycosyltransferase n=1 Tax=Caloramator sp. Dgby_cultured_2 TaxID=3029174 RepID=UPI00237D3B08|nr:glycosyltransferase [Caloramator sp. Dgby_cultured_2]WDU82725.1 glycosyltransferase [Caloramator sp. Dgby_cultured_2]
MNYEEREIMDEIMTIIKEHDLYGKVSMFPINGQRQLASAYRVFSKRKSIFCLTALYEPFGLAPIEAMYAGLPVVVTKNGGTFETVEGGKYGVLVDPEDAEDIARGLNLALDNFELYRELGIKRVEEKYTWEATAKGYLEVLELALIKREKIYKAFLTGSEDHTLKEKIKNML